jgi:hypothetical protein
MDGADFLLDAGSVFGQAAGDVKELAGNDVSDSAEDDEGDDAGDCDCEHTRDAAGFEAADCGGQQKGQGESEGEGDEKRAKNRMRTVTASTRRGPTLEDSAVRVRDIGPRRARMDGVACPGKNT